MPAALVVHLNRSTHHAIEPASDSFETDGPFVVRIRNHGEGSHVHCSLSGDLASAATVTDGNPFLEPDDVVEIPVDVRTDLRPARGTLELSTGYGREAVEIDVLVREDDSVPTSPIEPDREGAAGADVTTPATASDDAGGASDRPINDALAPIRDAIERATPRRDAGSAILAVLAVLALVVAIGAWARFDGVAVFLAVLLVLATILGAAIALVRQ